jgi:hypothetical protein
MLKSLSGVTVFFFAFLIGVFPQDAANPAMMVPFALMTGWLLASGVLGSLPLRSSATLLLTSLWLIWTLATLRSGVPFVSEVTGIVLATLPVSYFAALSLPRDGKTIRLLFTLLIAILCGLSVWSLADITISIGHDRVLTRGQGPFEDPNMLGLLLAMGTLLATAIPLPKRSIRFSLFALLLAGTIATGSRTAALGLLLGGSVLFLLTKPKIPAKIAAPFALLAIILSLATGLAGRFTSLLFGGKEMLGRLAIWNASAEMLTISPALGIGPGVFHLAYPPHRLPADDSAGWWVHMDPLQWGIESGWIAPALFYALCALVALRVRASHKAGTIPPLAAASAGALTCLFVGAHTAYPLYVAPFLILAGILLAVLSAPEHSTPSRSQQIFGAAIAIALLCTLWTGIRDGYTLALWNQAMTASHTRDAARFEVAVTACLDEGSRTFSDCASLLARAKTDSLSPPPEDVLTLLDRADRVNPYGAEPDYLRARYFLKLEKPENASFSLHSALRKNPAYWPARRLLVEILMKRKNYSEALNLLRAGKNYRVPRHMISYYKKTEQDILVRQGTTKP